MKKESIYSLVQISVNPTIPKRAVYIDSSPYSNSSESPSTSLISSTIVSLLNTYTNHVSFVDKIIHSEPCIRILIVRKLFKKCINNVDLCRYSNSPFCLSTRLISSIDVPIKYYAFREVDAFDRLFCWALASEA